MVGSKFFERHTAYPDKLHRAERPSGFHEVVDSFAWLYLSGPHYNPGIIVDTQTLPGSFFISLGCMVTARINRVVDDFDWFFYAKCFEVTLCLIGHGE